MSPERKRILRFITWPILHPWITLGIAIMGFAGYHMGFNHLARAHFDAHCENDAGEFIYKTVENVEGLYQMRLRDPEDYFDNLRHFRDGTGKLLEDPFGHTNVEAQRPNLLFIGSVHNKAFYKYQYFETEASPNEYDVSLHKSFDEQPIVTREKYWRYTLARVDRDGRSYRNIYHAEQTPTLKSRYGFTWREIRDEKDKQYGIWGGELIVKDMKTDETLAIRRGYLSFDFGICPDDKTDRITYYFINKVLKPIKID